MKDQAAVIGGKEHKQELLEQPMWDFIVDKNTSYGGGGSTDVGDVSWVVRQDRSTRAVMRSRYSASFLAGCCTGKNHRSLTKECWRQRKSWLMSALSFS